MELTENFVVHALEEFLQKKQDTDVVGYSRTNGNCPLARALRLKTKKMWHVSYYALFLRDSDEGGIGYPFETSILYWFVRLVDKDGDTHKVTAKEAREALDEATLKAGISIKEGVKI